MSEETTERAKLTTAEYNAYNDLMALHRAYMKAMYIEKADDEACGKTFMAFSDAVRALARAALSPPPDAPKGWRAVLKDLRLGLAAGSRSISNTDFEVEYGGALLDAVEEKLDALSAPTKEAL